VLGRPIAYIGVTLEQAEQAMKSRNMPDWLVGHLIAIAKLGANGAFSTENTGAIKDIVKRAPLTTRQFVEDNKSLFA
jgi:NAD(P)H dehydrogenase (quinone)